MLSLCCFCTIHCVSKKQDVRPQLSQSTWACTVLPAVDRACSDAACGYEYCGSLLLLLFTILWQWRRIELCVCSLDNIMLILVIFCHCIGVCHNSIIHVYIWFVCFLLCLCSILLDINNALLINQLWLLCAVYEVDQGWANFFYGGATLKILLLSEGRIYILSA